MKVIEPFWCSGEKSRLCELTGIKNSNISEILWRKRGVSVEKAIQLELACAQLGKSVPVMAWVMNRYTDHPAFYGQRKRIRAA